MANGIITYRSDGVAIITPDSAGGVFVQGVEAAPSSGTVRTTFTALGGMNIVVFVVIGGAHTWTQGVDGSGYPYIETVSLNFTAYNSKSLFMVFAK